MTPRSLGRRYATALFDVARKSGTVEAVGRDLSAFTTLVTGHAELRKVLEAPTVPASKKRAVVEALFQAGGTVAIAVEVRRLAIMLAEGDRLSILRDIAESFSEQSMSERRVMPAEIVTASPLGEARRTAVAQALGRATGCQVTIEERVDPAIIGGMIARVGSVVYDASVTRQLEKMRQRLLEE